MFRIVLSNSIPFAGAIVVVSIEVAPETKVTI
jgi:hypothetical protein